MLYMKEVEVQIKRFNKLLAKYKYYTRVGDLCVFRGKNCAHCVNISDDLLHTIPYLYVGVIIE